MSDQQGDKVVVRGIDKVFSSQRGQILALKGFNLTVKEEEFVCIVGPSGCGKSTFLRIVAGLIKPSGGHLFVRSSEDNDVPINSMIFQEHALFPWKTVLENVTFGLKMRSLPKKEREEIGMHYLQKVGLQDFARHYPHELSGGMKQRVGIVRAFANNPEILLMDEPLGALDAQTRTILQEEIIKIWEDMKKTVIFITHSIDEALILGDRIVLMTARPGRNKEEFVVPFGRPRSLKLKSLPEFGSLAYRIWELLKEEVARTLVGGNSSNETKR
jgi:NitT/TauT family transport system ATP-binding protein